MKKVLLITLILFGLISCKKEQAPQPSPKVYTYETITYIAYGSHNWYEIDYMEKGVQKHLGSSLASNKNWTYTYTDTVGTHKQLIYKSSLENDTMTAIIKINGITTDSIYYYSYSGVITLNR